MRTRRFGVAVVGLVTLFSIAPFETHAFDDHIVFTQEVLKEIEVVINGQPRRFTEVAIDQITSANQGTDHILTAALRNPELHFTNEEFATSSDLVLTRKARILNLLIRAVPDAQSVPSGLIPERFDSYQAPLKLD